MATAAAISFNEKGSGEQAQAPYIVSGGGGFFCCARKEEMAEKQR
jgi:hypothetical protein